jgi:hypothetical protein
MGCIRRQLQLHLDALLDPDDSGHEDGAYSEAMDGAGPTVCLTSVSFLEAV